MLLGVMQVITDRIGWQMWQYTDEPKHYHHLPNMLLVLRVLPKQHRPFKAWTLQDPWRCPVVSDTKTSAAHPSSPVCCKVESNLLVQHIPQMLNWIEIWGIRRPSQHLELFIMFLKPFLNNVCSVAECFILLKETTFTREHHWHEGVYLVCINV